MMNSWAAKLARAYRSNGCSWAKIGKKFGLSRQTIQQSLDPDMPTSWTPGARAGLASLGPSSRSRIGIRKDI
jgi:lambda repressor-like predicted transcriptional regulator